MGSARVRSEVGSTREWFTAVRGKEKENHRPERGKKNS